MHKFLLRNYIYTYVRKMSKDFIFKAGCWIYLLMNIYQS